MSEGFRLSFDARVTLAAEHALMVYEARNSYLGLDDLFEIADLWTTDPPIPDDVMDRWLDETGGDPESPMIARPDRRALLEALDRLTTHLEGI